MTKYTSMVVKNQILYTHKMNHRVGSNSYPVYYHFSYDTKEEAC